MSSGGGAKAVVAALGANLGIAATKFVAFAFSGSASMLAEAIHSVADSGNQVLLLVGGRRANRAPSAAHPFGYGAVRYLYAFLVSVVLFSVGGLFALYEGIHKVRHPEPIEHWRWLPVAVLLVSIVLEGYSFRTAVHEAAPVRAGRSWVRFVREAKAPELPVVLLEDTAALLGLVLALAGVGLTLVTGSGVWDGAGTVAIGVLLVCVAVVLAIETQSLLVGEAATPAVDRRIREALESEPLVERVIHLRTLHLGPDELLVAAKIAVSQGDSAASIAAAIDGAERRLRAAVDLTCVVYLEPDLDRGAGDTLS